MRQFARIAIVVTIYSAAFAQQNRVEMGWTGESGYSHQQTSSVDLPFGAYISDQRQQEFLRAETDQCADPSACKELKVEISQEALGAPFEKHIVQIVYTLAGATATSQMSAPYWKSIVIETRPGVYRELFLLKNEGGFWSWPPRKAEILSVATTRMLVTRDDTSSRDLWCTGEYWILEESGAKLVDFSDVVAAIGKTVPAGYQGVAPMCAAVDLEKLEVRSDVQKIGPECKACDLKGQVVVKFKLEGQRAVPVSAKLRASKTD